MEIDIKANRRARKYSQRELAARFLWSLLRPLFRLSPRPFFAWRNFLLRCFGARIGRSVRFENSVSVQYPWMLEVGDLSAFGDRALIYNLGKVIIGKRVTVSHQAHLCAGSHDYASAEMPLLRLPIRIGDDAWICTDAFVGPGVFVQEGAVVGARAAVFHDVNAWSVVGGNPARELKSRVVKECDEKAAAHE
jgi:putative colanic acid biosynthesis acetyltransferase WcaF